MNFEGCVMDIDEIGLRQQEMAMTEANAMLDAITQFAKITIQSVILVNGMAIVSILTFLGNITNKNVLCLYDKHLLFYSISAFCSGLFLGLLASAFAYLAQQSLREVYVFPEAEEEKDKKGILFRRIALFCVLSSTVLFIVGAFCALYGILGV